MSTRKRLEAIRWGLSNGLPIALGYLPVAVTFGILGRQSGLSVGVVTAMSAWVYAGASQFLAVKMIASEVGLSEIILATLILNFRHFLMSTALARKIRTSKIKSAALSYWVTDETFVVASVHAEPGEPSALSFWIMAVMAYLSWLTGTLAGGVFADLIPMKIVNGMGIGLYALFIALLIPSARKHWQFALVAVASALGAWGVLHLIPGISEGWALIAATLGVSALGTLLPDVEEAT
ncbi:MAG: AzlC family ABC transporter permease [Spirochaetaceae bacterium]|nr:MAG: AzlC family ABC transporter permease [Spirochaetaceae bacterium]